MQKKSCKRYQNLLEKKQEKVVRGTKTFLKIKEILAEYTKSKFKLLIGVFRFLALLKYFFLKKYSCSQSVTQYLIDEVKKIIFFLSLLNKSCYFF